MGPFPAVVGNPLSLKTGPSFSLSSSLEMTAGVKGLCELLAVRAMLLLASKYLWPMHSQIFEGVAPNLSLV